MSQFETTLLIVLGFAIATFLALLAGRLAWKLALRLGARRAQRNIPATVVDLQSDRDRLRAEQAILSRKIEVRLDEMKMRLAEQTAEVTRNRNRVETLMQQNAALEQSAASRDAEIAMLRELVQKLEAELSERAVLADGLQSSLNTKEEEIAGLQKSFLERLDATEQTVVDVPSRLDRRIKKLTTRKVDQSKRAEATADDGSVNASDFTKSVVVKPAGGQEIEVTPLADAPKKPIDPGAVASQLENELKRMDEAWDPPAKPEAVDADKPEEPAEEPQKRSVTNVISLAQRIKALQREIAG
jgi:phage terminase Nu1 subunit (DNA packaging protein)